MKEKVWRDISDKMEYANNSNIERIFKKLTKSLSLKEVNLQT